MITNCFHAWKNVVFLHVLSVIFDPCRLCRICTVTRRRKPALFQAFADRVQIEVLTFSWHYVYITFYRLRLCCELSTFSTGFSTRKYSSVFNVLPLFYTKHPNPETDFVDFINRNFVTIIQISRVSERFEKRLDRQNAGFAPPVMIQSRPLSANDT